MIFLNFLYYPTSIYKGDILFQNWLFIWNQVVEGHYPIFLHWVFDFLRFFDFFNFEFFLFLPYDFLQFSIIISYHLLVSLIIIIHLSLFTNCQWVLWSYKERFYILFDILYLLILIYLLCLIERGVTFKIDNYQLIISPLGYHFLHFLSLWQKQVRHLGGCKSLELSTCFFIVFFPQGIFLKQIKHVA